MMELLDHSTIGYETVEPSVHVIFVNQLLNFVLFSLDKYYIIITTLKQVV